MTRHCQGKFSIIIYINTCITPRIYVHRCTLVYLTGIKIHWLSLNIVLFIIEWSCTSGFCARIYVQIIRVTWLDIVPAWYVGIYEGSWYNMLISLDVVSVLFIALISGSYLYGYHMMKCCLTRGMIHYNINTSLLYPNDHTA
jgi:hypothetical protein